MGFLHHRPGKLIQVIVRLQYTCIRKQGLITDVAHFSVKIFESVSTIGMFNLITICKILQVINNMQSENSNEINDFSVLLKIKYIKDKLNP